MCIECGKLINCDKMERCECGGKLELYITYETHTVVRKHFYGDREQYDTDYENGIMTDKKDNEHIYECVRCGKEIQKFVKGEYIC